MLTVSFPGLGLENVSLRATAFTLPLFGGLAVTYSALLLLAALAAGGTVAYLRARRRQISGEDMLDYTIYMVIAGVVLSRAFYVLGSLPVRSVYKIFAVWEGGLSLDGLLLAGILAVLAVAKLKKRSPLPALDALIPAVLLGLGISAIGDMFIGAESATVEATLPWRMGLLAENGYETLYYHPVFLYEVLWCLLGAVLLMTLGKRLRFDGAVCLCGGIWLGLDRLLIDGLRVNALRFGVFRVSSLFGLSLTVISAVLLARLSAKHSRAERTSMDYEPKYAKFTQSPSRVGDTARTERDEKDNEKENN